MNLSFVDILAIAISAAALIVAIVAECGVRRFRRDYEKPLAGLKIRQAERNERERLLADMALRPVERVVGVSCPAVRVVNNGRHDATNISISFSPRVPFEDADRLLPYPLLPPGESFLLRYNTFDHPQLTAIVVYSDGTGQHTKTITLQL